MREEIVQAWLPMAHRLAARYRDRGESEEDLRQVAALALVKAVDRYDPQQGTPFGAFAIPTINGELKRHFRDYLWAVHVPRRVQELRNLLRRARQELEATPHEGPISVKDLVEHTGLSEGDVLLGLEAQYSFASKSLDEPLSCDNAHSLGDVMGQDDPALAVVEDRATAAPLLHELPERERHILYLRFFRNMTQSEIASAVGISQMHVSRLLRRSCAQVRTRALADQAPVGPGPRRR